MDIYLVDGNSFIYRAFFAIRGLRDSKGRPTNAIFGFANMMMKLLRELKPDGLAICFDRPELTERHRLFVDYKAHRPGAPDELIEQIPAIRKFIEAMRIKVFELPGYEADDIIAVIADKAAKAGHKVFIITGDKDMLQLVGNGIKVYDPMKNVILDEEYVKERFGVPPQRIPEFMALMGDAVDNIPGVKGIGEKTAKDLLQQFENLDELMAHPERIKKERTRCLIEENTENIKLSRQLAVIQKDLPIKVDLKELAGPGPDWARLLTMFQEYEFTSLMKQVPGGPPPGKEYEAVLTEEKLKDLLKGIKEDSALSIHVNNQMAGDPAHGGASLGAKIIGLGLAGDSGDAFYVPLRHEYAGAPEQIPAERAFSILKEVFENGSVSKTGHDLKRTMILLQNEGIALKGTLYDMMIASHLLNPLKGEHTLETVTLEFLSIRKKTREEVAPKGMPFKEVDIMKAAGFAAHEAELCRALKGVLFPRLKEEGLEDAYFKIEMPLVPVLARMEMTGVKVDSEKLKALSEELDKELEAIKKRIFMYAGEEFNINSPRQLGHILFDVLKLKPGKKGKTGYSTAVGVLEELAKEHELPREVLEWRELFKLKCTYVDVLPEIVNPATGRIHTSFNQTITATGRLSSTNPNLQNIPIKGKWGIRVREAFVPEEGAKIISADYSQIELRVLAHLSGDEALKGLFIKGMDIHASTASEIFGVAPENVTSDMRRVAKSVNFGVVYGITPFGLSEQLGIGKDEAANYINRYFERHPGVKKYIEEIIKKALKDGFVRTISGRKRPIPELRGKDARTRALGERLAMNSPVQGSAADIIKKAMISLSEKLRGFNTRLTIQVHDELVFESPEEEIEKVLPLIKEEMEGAASLGIPADVEIGVGDNWAEAH
jgi:DNA polymerase-1